MTDMIEKVARAIFEQFKRALGGEGGFDDLTGEERLVMTGLARAAIEAMREPTKEMIIAGNDTIDECIDFWNYDSGAGYCVETFAANRALTAMIDAALTPTTAKGEE